MFRKYALEPNAGLKICVLPPSMQPSDCIKVCIQDVGVRVPAELLRLSLSKHKKRQSCDRSEEHQSRFKHRFIQVFEIQCRNSRADKDNRMSIRLFGVHQKDKNFDSGWPGNPNIEPTVHAFTVLIRNYKKIQHFQSFRAGSRTRFGAGFSVGFEAGPNAESGTDSRAEFESGSRAGPYTSSGDGSYVGSLAGFKAGSCVDSCARIEAGAYSGSLAGSGPGSCAGSRAGIEDGAYVGSLVEFEPGSCAGSRAGIGAVSQADFPACFGAGSYAGSGTGSRIDIKK
ncbi:hypothetical protein PV328_001362 [Microctonus aethiopoides]|uniref:Uncharacterized protein n=1 Tax=Microctonus aethiopoides TaxID=144406 RepID=A0AA39KXE2_9HYME|nr:hypothetical protein PV328_001362 [Microctonus aethiopoides]